MRSPFSWQSRERTEARYAALAFMVEPISFTPIGTVRSPFHEKFDAPRQPIVSKGTEGRIELFTGFDFEHALEDLDGWDRIWVIFVFDRNKSWRPKVLPPRSEERRGVFSTRSPHRPNPIGLSVVQLVRVEIAKLTLHIRDVDMLDGSPVLDVKPYVPYADAFPDAKTGWLGGPADPAPSSAVVWTARAEAEAAWLAARGVDVVAPVNAVLTMGAQPNAYRRIRRGAHGGMQLAVKEWRARFEANEAERVITVTSIHSGFRPRDLESEDETARDPALDLHKEFRARFATSG